MVKAGMVGGIVAEVLESLEARVNGRRYVGGGPGAYKASERRASSTKK